MAFIATMMDAGVEFVACDNPRAIRLTLHILAAVAEHSGDDFSPDKGREAAKARGVRLGRNAERLASAKPSERLSKHEHYWKELLSKRMNA